MVDACVTVDYVATIAITVLMVYFLFRMSKMYLSPPIRTFLTLVTGLYMATYVYTTFLVGVFSAEFLNYVIALLALLVVLLVSFYLNAHVLVLGLLLVLTMEGYAWYAVLSVSLLVGVIFAIIVYAYELDYIGLLIWDSLFVALGLVIGALALATNTVTSLESQIPSACRVPISGSNATDAGHLNMLLPCDPRCGSVASMQYDRSLLIGVVIGLAVLRFGIVYYREVCGIPKEELRAGYKKQQVLRRSPGPSEPETKQPPESKKRKAKKPFSCVSFLAALCPGGRDNGDKGAPFTALVAQPGDNNEQQSKQTKKNKKKKQTREEDSPKRRNSLADDDSDKFTIEMDDVLPSTVDLKPPPELKREIAVPVTVEPEVKETLREIAVVAPSASVIEELREHKATPAEEEALMLA